MQIKKLLDGNTFVKSTAIVLAVSFIGAFSLFILGINFWAAFLLFVVFQYVLFSFIGNVISFYIVEDRKKKELDKLEKLSTLLDCAYCAKPNIMTFDPDDSQRYEFECSHCKRNNLVTMQFMVSQISIPLEIPKVTGIPSDSL
jgi:hypothetical protein